MVDNNARPSKRFFTTESRDTTATSTDGHHPPTTNFPSAGIAASTNAEANDVTFVLEPPNRLAPESDAHLPPTTSFPLSGMAENNVQTLSSPPAAELTKESIPQPEAALQDVIDTMHDSDIFPRIAKDVSSRFWSAYERVAKQHDDECLERYNGEMDVLLIFAGLFSGVSSSFITNMRSSLSPNPTDTTNALLMKLINIHVNGTFPAQEAALPVWTGPSSTTVWIQSLAYTSLSSSLLAAFGAVLEKQWLGHFKTSRFGKGALPERCQRRQQKFDGLNVWHFSTIISILPILLQLSLLFFGVALATSLWTQEHTVASVVMATTAFGSIFYFFTLVASLKSPNCPFQTPISTLVQHALPAINILRNEVRMNWAGRPKTWSDFREYLRQSSQHALSLAKDLIIRITTSFVTYLLRNLEALRQLVRSSVHHATAGVSEQSGAFGGIQSSPESAELAGEFGLRRLGTTEAASSGPGAAGEQSFTHHDVAGNTGPSGAAEMVQPGPDDARRQTVLLEELDLSFLDSTPSSRKAQDSASFNAVLWTLETTTDMDVITTAARMITEIEWPAKDVTKVLEHLKGHFYACFHRSGKILPLAQALAVACLRAIYQFTVEQDLTNPFWIHENGNICTTQDYRWYHMLRDRDFLVVYCAVENSVVTLDMASLPISDRTWMAHMLAYHLHTGHDLPAFVGLVNDFINVCLDSESPRLVGDCLLLACQLVGMRVDRRHLARLDKRQDSPCYTMPSVTLHLCSKAIKTLRLSVMSRTLGLLLGDIPGHEWQQRALKLIHPLLQYLNKNRVNYGDRRLNKRCLKYCFRLLEQDSGTDATDHPQVRSRTVAHLIYLFRCHLDWKPRSWYTQTQFDMLVDYHLRICQGTDNDAIMYTFKVLWLLHGSPSTLERMRRYIDTTIPFIGQRFDGAYFALSAICQVRTAVVSIGRDDGSFRRRFSTELASVVLSDVTQPVPHDINPFKKISFIDWWRDVPYLELLSTLSEDAIWQPQLRQNGHLDNCLVIAQTLASQTSDVYDEYAIPVAHILVNIDVSAVDAPIWSLILRAWNYIFNLPFFGGAYKGPALRLLSDTDCIESLLIISAYARRRGGDGEEALTTLVEQVCRFFGTENEASEQGDTRPIQEQPSVGSPEIRDLGRQIRKLLHIRSNL